MSNWKYLLRAYRSNPVMQSAVSLCQGVLLNFLYVVFRFAASIYDSSAWFLAIAVYYLALGSLRVYLIFCFRSRTPEKEVRCYRRTAWLLFLLNLPMGGMILLTVRTSSGFFYPGHIIYASALYTFYAFIQSIRSLVRFRKIGSPILSAAKVLNFIAAMMSILALQTAMIPRFSENSESFRILMNALTGGGIWCIVILIAIYMLLYSRQLRHRIEFPIMNGDSPTKEGVNPPLK